MEKAHHDEADDVVWITVPLDPRTAARLQNVSDECFADRAQIAASILHDVLEDDEDHHGGPAGTTARTLN